MNDNSVLTLLCAGGIAFIGYEIYKKNNKTMKLAYKMENCLDAMEEKIEIGDTSFLVKDAVDRIVEKTVDSEIQKAISNIKNDICNDINAQVKSAIEEAYCDVRKSVEDELSNKIGQVSIEPIRKRVIDNAAEIASKKFANDLEVILDRYNDELGNVSKIYGSIARNIAPSYNIPGLRAY